MELFDLLVEVPACGGGFLVATSAPTVVAVFDPPACAGDISGDGIVDGIDIASVLGSWGSCRSREARSLGIARRRFEFSPAGR